MQGRLVQTVEQSLFLMVLVEVVVLFFFPPSLSSFTDYDNLYDHRFR